MDSSRFNDESVSSDEDSGALESKSTSTSYKSSSPEETRAAKYRKILPIAEMDDSTSIPSKVPSLIGEDVWSTLVSQIDETPTIHVASSKFTIGSDQSCSHVLQGRYIGRLLCKIIKPAQHTGLAVLESTSGRDYVMVNGIPIKKYQCHVLYSGDSLDFGFEGIHSYIFKIVNNDDIQIGRLSLPTEALLTSFMQRLDLKTKDSHNIISHDLNDLNYCSKVPSGTGTSTSAASNINIDVKYAIRDSIMEPKNIKTTFENFPFSLRECTKNMLIAACIIPLKCKEQLNCCENLSVLSPRVLLTGPPEIYQETLAKALAHYFDAKLLIYDHRRLVNIISWNEAAQAFKLGDNVKFCSPYGKNLPSLRGPVFGCRGKVVLTFDGNPLSKIGVRFVEPIAGGVDLGGACEVGHGYFCDVTDLERVEPELETSLIDALFEVVHSESNSAPFILFIKDTAETKLGNGYPFSFGTKLQALPNNVVVIGSQTLTHNDPKKDIVRFHDEGWELSNRKLISKKFLPNEITVSIPQDEAEALLASQKEKMSRDIETHTIKRNVHQLRIVLRHYKFECKGLETLCIKDQILSSECANKIVGWAVSYHLMQMQNPNHESTIVLSQESINFGLGLLQSSQSEP